MRFRKKSRSLFFCLFLLAGFSFLQLFSYPVMAAIPVTTVIPVLVTGENTEEAFNCILQMEESEFQTVETGKLTLKNGEGSAFIISYTCPGTYHGTISQEKGNDSQTTYDDTVYSVDIFVTEDEKGKLYAEPVIYTKGSDSKSEGVQFNNKKVTSPGTTKRVGSINTGDATNFILYGALIGLSACGLCAALVLYRKRR